jgi:hypothetical protein
MYEQELLNCFEMCSLSLSLCCYRKIWLVHDLNIIRCKILSNKILNSYYTSVQAEPVTQLHRLSSLKARIIKKSLWKIQTSYGLLLYLWFLSLFSFWSGPRADKFLMSVDTVLRSGVYHLLPADHDCIKFRIEFRATECLLAYFLTFCAKRPTCVLSTAQTQEQRSLPFFQLYT